MQSLGRAFLAVMALAWASVGHADFIQIDYSGLVRATGGDGLGFAVGDALSGQIRFDPAQTSVVECFPAECDYSLPGTSDSLIGTALGALTAFLNIADHGGSACSNLCDNYRLNAFVNSISGDIETSRSNFVWAHDDVTDFIQGTGLEQFFTLTPADITFNGIMFGRLSEVLTDSMGNLLSHDTADYILTSMSVTTVPEPAAIALLGLGLLASFATLRRRRLQ